MRFLLILCITMFNIVVLAQGSKTFDINSSTLFFSESGQKLSFKDFSFITSNYKNSILPKFDASGELEYITLKYPSEADAFVGKVELDTKPVSTEPVSKYSNSFNSSAMNYDSYNNVKDLEGMSAPNFSVLDANNMSVGTNELIGTVIVLKFWFSKCIPCLEEIPELNRLAQKYNSENIRFLAPSVEKKYLTENFLLQNIFEYTTIYEAQDLAALYKTPGYPTHVIIGKDGKVRKVLVGKRTNIFKVLDEEIERALLVRDDDKDVLELDEHENFVLNEHTVITDDLGNVISMQEYVYLLNTGRYKIFKRIKKNGNTNLLITKKN